MDCSRFEETLDLILSGELDREESTAAEAHRAGCPRCRELLQIASGDLDILPRELREELSSSILVRTTGPVCQGVEAHLCERIDGRLSTDDDEVVSSHLEHCESCRALCETLEWMQVDLSLFAEIAPDRMFVQDVLEATLYRRSWWQRSADRIRSWWNHQIHRPRFAVEIAFSGAMIMLLLFGTPRSPLREVPPRAVEIARTNPVHSALHLLEDGTRSLRPVTDYGRETLERAGDPIARDSGELKRRLSGTAGKVRDVAEITGDHLERIPGAIWKGDLVQAWNLFTDMWQAIDDRWQEGRDVSPEEVSPEP